MAVDPKLTAEELADMLSKLLSAKVDEIRALTEAEQEAKAEELSRYLVQVEKLVGSYDRLMERREAAKELADKLGESTAAGKAQLAEAKRLQLLANMIKLNEQSMEKATKAGTPLRKLLQELGTRAVPLKRQLEDAAKSQEKWNKNIFKSAEAGGVLKTLGRVGTGAVAGLVTALKEVTPQMAAIAAFMPNINFRTLRAEMAGMANSYDRGFRDIMKKGFTFQDEMEGVFLSTFDVRGGLKVGALGMENAKNMLVGLGLTATESSKAFLALKENAMFFTAKNIKDNRGFMAETANLVAGLSKLGVQYKDSAAAFDIFTKSLQQAPRQALTSTKRLIKIAESLDISTGKAFRDFTQLMPQLAQFGDRAIEVFGKLEAQARATGIQVGTLSKMAQGLDTFKGAAKAAQGLNAVLGGTFISMTDLVHADPAEKINIIRKAFAAAGVDFSTTHRRVKQLVASLLGQDPQTVTRLLGSKSDYDTITQSLDTTATSAEEMRDKLRLQMTAGERLKKGLSHLGLGMSKLVKIGHTTARQASNALTKTFFKIESKVNDASEAVIAFGTAIKGIQALAGIRNKALIAGAGLGVLQGLSDDQRKKVMERVMKEMQEGAEFSMELLKEAAKSLFPGLISKASPPKGLGATRTELAKAKKGRQEEGKPGPTEQEKLLAAMTKFFNTGVKVPIVIENKLMIDKEVLASSTEPGTLDLLRRIFGQA